MENKIYGYVYMIINLINNKRYIGQTVETIKIRFSKHCSSKKTVISKAIKKYGRENFIVQELAVAYNQEQLTFLEGMYISWFNTLVSNGCGYNVTNIISGNGKMSIETKQKLRKKANSPKRLETSSKNGKSRRGKITNNCNSKYIGVHKKSKKFISQLSFNKKSIYLGVYNTEIDAAKAYDIKAIEIVGKDCVLNFPELRESYINHTIIVNNNTHQNYSKSGIKGLSFDNYCNKWRFHWKDKVSEKRKCKTFKYLDDAIQFKLSNNL